MLEEVASYTWAHSNSLIKNLTLFEDDAEIRLLNFLMKSIFKQPEDTFIKKTFITQLGNWKTMFWVISQD